MRKLWLSIPACLIVAQGLSAQTEQFVLGNSVVSATGFEQDIKDAPASISVITGEEIMERPIRDLGDIVQEIPVFLLLCKKLETQAFKCVVWRPNIL